MSVWVIDCSAAAAAFLEEPDGEHAMALITCGDDVTAPDLIDTEFGSVLWKRCMRGQMTEAEAAPLLCDFLNCGISRESSHDLVQRALELALTTKRSVYDCLYLAMAVDLDTVLYTGDMRFLNSLQNTPMAKHVAPISSFPLST